MDEAVAAALRYGVRHIDCVSCSHRLALSMGPTVLAERHLGLHHGLARVCCSQGRPAVQAEHYGNEPAIGRALSKAFKAGFAKREETFVTSKLWSVPDLGCPPSKCDSAQLSGLFSSRRNNVFVQMQEYRPR